MIPNRRRRITVPILALLVSLTGFVSVGCRAEAPASNKDLRAAFRQEIFAGRKTCALNPRPVSQNEIGPIRTERVKITPEEGQDAIVALYRPKAEGKYPAVIVQHFLGGTKDHFALLPLMNALAQKGFVVAAIDGRYRGDRQNGTTLAAAMLESLRTGKGHPFLIDTAYDITRLIDYLQTRPDVDGSRIGMTGFSEGGVLTWMSAVIDERIKVAVPIIGVTCFADTLKAEENPAGEALVKLFEPTLQEYAKDLGEKQCNCKVLHAAWEKLFPGSQGRFDATNLVPLIAPRPLLVICHEQDELFPIEGAKKVEVCTMARYQELKASDHFDFRVDANLKHAAFSLSDATGLVDWMDRWLKGGTMAVSGR